MKRILTYFVLLFLMSPTALAQSWDDIKNSSIYLWGEGSGATIGEADQNALAHLISKISVQVKSEFEQVEDETVKGSGGIDAETRMNYRVKTYSQATLTNTEQLIISNEPDAVVGRYIKKSELNRIFEGRKLKVVDMVEVAQRAEKEGKVDDALRHYYWAYTLLRSLPHCNEVKWQDKSLTVWLPQQMNNVFDDIKAEVTGRDGDNVDLRFTFRGRPVSSLDYTYFDGRMWSSIYSAKDGVGVLELSNGGLSHVQLKYEFEYRNEARIDRELESVITVEKSIPMRKSYQDISIGKTQQAPVSQAQSQTASLSTQTTNAEAAAPLTHGSIARQSNMAEVSDGQKYQEVIDKVVAAIKSRNYTTVSDYFTAEGADIYRKLIHYGQARIVGDTKCTFLPYRQWVMGRSVPMSFSFKNGLRKSFVEDVVFTFDKESGKICNLSFGLGLTAEQDIMSKGKWTDLQRLQMLDFMENYKTAFALKRLDYLKSIFADDAVIIVGNMVKRPAASMTDGRTMNFGNNKLVQFNRYTKNEYMRKLETSFRSNEFINIRFTNNEVRSTKTNDVFGIQIKQDYYSSNYGDTGYLFLMVDMRNADEPLIKIRTWQPEKDKVEGIYGLEHF